MRRGILVLATIVALAGCAGAAPTPETIYIPLTIPPETPSPTPEPTPTPTPEPTPTPTPTPSPTSPAAGCTATPEQQAYFVNAAIALPYDVYCAVLPAGWILYASQFTKPDGGRMWVLYRNNAGEEITLIQGKICADLTTCLDIYPTIGPAAFDGLTATIRTMGPGLMVAVNPHSLPGYTLFSGDLSQAKLTQLAAAVIKVPKP
jgi:hypothetical protein